jgi:hypothetical protein
VPQARLSGEISRATWLWNAQRYEILPVGVSVEDEAALIEAEPPQKMSGAVE